MRRQFEYADGYAYNAGRMFRAVGSPEGHDPESWLDKAAPLVTGLQGYFANLDGLAADHDFDEGEIVFESVMEEELLGMEIDNRFMTFLLAMAYSRYLDSKPERAHEALARIRSLYAVEVAGKGLDEVDRLALRRERSVPLLERLGTWSCLMQVSRGRWRGYGVQSSKKAASRVLQLSGWVPFDADAVDTRGVRACPRITPPPSCNDTWAS